MPRLDVQIPAPDGESHGTLHVPDGEGPARHGFAVADNPTYDPEANARHWAALSHLYQTHLGEKGA